MKLNKTKKALNKAFQPCRILFISLNEIYLCIYFIKIKFIALMVLEFLLNLAFKK